LRLLRRLFPGPLLARLLLRLAHVVHLPKGKYGLTLRVLVCQ
jgi:hypothetical protein